MTGVMRGMSIISRKLTKALRCCRLENSPSFWEPEAEGGFTVRVPSLPEIVTYGKDEAEALAMAEDAIRLVLERHLGSRRAAPDG
jgi:predicted RNase H-like HicB family nuclease